MDVLSLMVRLGKINSKEGSLDGAETIAKYRQYLLKVKYTWMGFNLATSLPTAKVTTMRGQIKTGKKPKVYFVLHENSGNKDGIEFEADILNIVTSNHCTFAPDGNVPPIFPDQGNVWLKVSEIRRSAKTLQQFIPFDQDTNLVRAGLGEYKFIFVQDKLEIGSTHQNPIINHPDYPEEIDRLTRTIEAIEEVVEQSEAIVQRKKKKIRELNKDHDHGSDNAKTVEIYLAGAEEKNQSQLQAVIDKPYFGRLDYQDDANSFTETFYIGRIRIDGPEDIQVYEWQTPFGSLYYEGRTGRVTYNGNGEAFAGEISLRRRYEIKNRVLENFIDDKIMEALQQDLKKPGAGDARNDLIADPYLIKRLEQNADNKLRDIVETIQAEQNKIIREPLSQVTLVQGVAGSGKSTIALHRVSYLLYHNKQLKPESILFIAPNPIFLDYISSVLPDLDSSGVDQKTFPQLAWMLLGKEYVLAEDEKTDLFLVNDQGNLVDSFKSLLLRGAKLKGSLAYRRAVDEFITSQVTVLIDQLDDIDLYNGKITISKVEQVAIISDQSTPYNKRIERLKKFIEQRIHNFLYVSDGTQASTQFGGSGSSGNTMGYVARVKEYFDQRLYFSELLSDAEKDDLKKQQEALLKRIPEIRNNFLKTYFKDWKVLNVDQCYRDFMNGDWLGKVIQTNDQVAVAFMQQYSIKLLELGQLEKEDLAALCYLKQQIDGIEDIAKYQHIVVDEAQDLNLFEFSLLRGLSQGNSFTIVGDLAQGISPFNGLESWGLLANELFTETTVKFFEVKQSYRSTWEIVEFANSVLPEGMSRAVPVYRRGELPKLEQFPTHRAKVKQVYETCKELFKKGCQSVAVIAKRDKDCKKIYQLLDRFEDKGIQVNLITPDCKEYLAGISVVPLMLAKGLEFDGVIIWDASETYFKNNLLDAKLLYVAMSRALHYLYVYYTGTLTPLIKRK